MPETRPAGMNDDHPQGPDFAWTPDTNDVNRLESVPSGPPHLPTQAWPEPAGKPVRDLLLTPPGQSLSIQVEAAHQAGQRPTLLRRLLLGKRAYSSWELGQIGERLVAEELSKHVKKDPRWGFLNSIPIGKNDTDIDHLVVGPGGVFTINAKYHRGANIWVGGNTYLVNGTYHPYVRNSRYEAKSASRLLAEVCGFAVEARGLVVPVGAEKLTIREQPPDIHVVSRGHLRVYLRQCPVVLSPERVSAVLSVARLSSTWEYK